MSRHNLQPRPKKASHQDWMQAKAARDGEAIGCYRALNNGQVALAQEQARRAAYWDTRMAAIEAELDQA